MASGSTRLESDERRLAERRPRLSTSRSRFDARCSSTVADAAVAAVDPRRAWRCWRAATRAASRLAFASAAACWATARRSSTVRLTRRGCRREPIEALCLG